MKRSSKENDKKKTISHRNYPTDADYAGDRALLVNSPTQAKLLLHSLEEAAGGIGLHMNAKRSTCVLIKRVPSPLSMAVL